MWRLPRTSIYSYLRVAVIQIDVHPTGETWSTCHTHFTFDPHMALNHTYLTWSMYSNLSWVVNRVRQMHYSREKVLLNPPLSPAEWPVGSASVFSQHNRWSSALKPSICWWQTIRLTEPISPAWDQYVQYLLVGANPSILNRHMWGYNFGGADLSHHTLQPSQPTILHFLPKGPVRSQVINLIITN
jgi:hypothetical protein